jgi:hypothetical protein
MDVDATLQVRDIFLPLVDGKVPRQTVVVAHRRAGKTISALQRMLTAAIRTDAPAARYGLVAPFRTQAKALAWDPLKALTAPIPGLKVSESELWVELPTGARLRLYGADQPDVIRGGYFDGVVMDEYAQMDPRTWDEVIRPMLVDRQGWAQFIGTPAGKNGFYRLYEQAADAPDWQRFEFRASTTGIIPELELAALRRSMSREAYEQEFECSFTSASKGAFYGELMEAAEKQGRITRVPFDPALACVTSWDLGVRDATAIWVLQPAPGGAILAVDFIESAGVGLPWYANELRLRGYTYTGHVAPPDIGVTEFGSGLSRREVAANHGIRFDTARAHRVMDGIEAVRTLIPRMYFDREKCARGIEALGLYRQEWDGKLQAFKPTPLHDWTSHAADALRYFAMSELRNAPNEQEWGDDINEAFHA